MFERFPGRGGHPSVFCFGSIDVAHLIHIVAVGVNVHHFVFSVFQGSDHRHEFGSLGGRVV